MKKQLNPLFVESETLELKRCVNQNIATNIVAFLNTMGGRIIVGVDDSKDACLGVEDVDKEMLAVQRFCELIEPNPLAYVSFEVSNIGGASILIVNVQESRDTIFAVKDYKGLKYYRRVGDRNELVSLEKLTDIALSEKGVRPINTESIDIGTPTLPTLYKIGKLSGTHFFKYMSLETALICLQNGSIRFAEPSKWPDKCERRFYCATIMGNLQSDENPPLVACCLTYAQDNEAAWKLYSYDKKGLDSRCLEFKINRMKFRQEIMKGLQTMGMLNDYNVYQGTIEYIPEKSFMDIHRPFLKTSKIMRNKNYDRFFRPFGLTQYLNLMLMKRNGFLHEQEVRFYIVPKDASQQTKNAWGKLDIKIDWKNVVEEIRIGKETTDFETQLLENELNRLGIKKVNGFKLSKYDIYRPQKMKPIEVE